MPPTNFSLIPIGYVGNSRLVVEDDNWRNVVSTITLHTPFTEEARLGLEDFSHAEIIFIFDQVPDYKIETGALSAQQRRLAQSRHFSATGQKPP
jgi:tRNA (Thr-GGU) A37 N-methylase